MIRRTAFALSLGMFVAGCDGGEKKPPADPKIVAEAKQIWDTRCSTCHGPNGDGNGPGAVALKAKPRGFNNAKWQGDTTDERIKKVILEGGAAVGLSAEMAPNPDLQDKPAVIDELVRLVRGFV